MGAGVAKSGPGNASTSIHTNSQHSNTRILNMTCEACAIRFSLLKRKKICQDCGRLFCTGCVQTTGKINGISQHRCSSCRSIVCGEFSRSDLMRFRVKDLQFFLRKKNIPLTTCTEKDDLIELIFQHFGGVTYHLSQLQHEQHVEHLAEQMRKRRAEEEARVSLGRSQELQHTMTNDGGHDEDVPTMPNMEDVGPDEDADRNDDESDTADEDNDDERSDVRVGGDETASPGTSEKPASQRFAKLGDVQAKDDISGLTVRQLKEILTHNFVTYKGCCERWELEKHVTRLWVDNKSNQLKADALHAADDEGEKNLTNQDLCKICMDNLIDCVLLECGHMVTCSMCGKQLSECPICRQYVVRAVHIFRS